MLHLRELEEFNPAAKTGEEGYKRACKVVSRIRMNASPIIEPKRAKRNKEYLYADQGHDKVRKMYKDPDKAGVEFVNYGLVEKIRNVLIEEREEGGINFRLKSTDAMAVNQKDRDFELLKNRSWIEPLMTGVNKVMGLPAYDMMEEKGMFNGNVEDFDKMGLEKSSSEDLNYFYSTHYRLLHEMVGEEPINYFVKYNELDQMIAPWYDDGLAFKCMASRSYVNEMTGAIEYRYCAPAHMKAIAGIKRDYKDASAILIEEPMSIGDIIKMIGNDFDFARDMGQLLQAVNSASSTNYTGIMSGDHLYYGKNDGTTISSTDFFMTKISVGYVEWKEFDASTHQVWRNNSNRLTVKPVDYYTPERANSKYSRDCRYYQTTYKAYYFNVGAYDSPLYKYGKLNHQMVTGVEDEYSNFSFAISHEYGKSIIDIAIPYIDSYHKVMSKLEYMIVRAKPPGRMWNFESMLTMAKASFPGIPVHQQLTNLMAKFNGMSDEMYSIPTINGQPVGGGGAMNYDLPHGLSASAITFQQLGKFYEDQIMEKIGISPLRSAYQPGQKDGLGLQEQSTAYSEKATNYLNRMVNRQVKNIGIRTLSYCQDIINYNDKQSLPYKYLLKALGDNTMEEMGHLKKFAFHRYNIFVEGLGSMADKREAVMMANRALDKGEITYEQWLLIKNIESPRKAITVLAYEKKRNERVAQQSQQAAAQQAGALEDKKHKNKMEEISLAGELDNKRENTRGYWLAQSAKISSESDLLKQREKSSIEPELLKQKEDAKIAEGIAQQAAETMAPMAQA